MGLDTHRVSDKVSKITSRHPVPLDRAFPGTRIVARIEIEPPRSQPPALHRPIAHESGRPMSVIAFSTLHATTASTVRPPGVLARRPSPMIDLYLSFGAFPGGQAFISSSADSARRARDRPPATSAARSGDPRSANPRITVVRSSGACGPIRGRCGDRMAISVDDRSNTRNWCPGRRWRAVADVTPRSSA